MNEYNELIKNICDELKIKCSFLSDGWVKVLEKNNKTRYIDGFKFGNNSHSLGNIMDDKGEFFELMKYYNLPIIEHKIILRTNYNEDDIINYFNLNHQDIIVKGNIGTCGREVFRINDKNELLSKVKELFITQFSISLCPYYDIINEYRVILLNNVPRLVYGKKRPIVYGDGKSSLKELAINFNPIYYKNKINQTFNNYVPKKHEKVMLNYQFNLSKGSIPFKEIDPILKGKIINLAISVTKNLNINFASIDIIHTLDNRLLVMEANSGVMIVNFYKHFNEDYVIIKNIYKDAIREMFKL